MAKNQEWRRISYLRGIIKDRKTPINKKPSGNISGGVILTDEHLKPYMETLAALEAKMNANREQMSTVERNHREGDNTTETTAHGDATTMQPLCNHPVCNYFATTMHLLCTYYMQLLCKNYARTMQLLCNHAATTSIMDIFSFIRFSIYLG